MLSSTSRSQRAARAPRLATTTAILALLAGLLLVGGAGAGHAGQAARTTPTSYAQQAFAATNTQRKAARRVALGKNACLQRYATRQAKAMARRQSMFHQQLGPIMSACKLSMVGENVAYGYTSGRAAVAGWMGSPGHRANILNPRYRLLAVGAAQASNGQWYSAQVFGRR
ncbi:hypothetical protein GCM10023226_13770 [Nocardioides nanhaiensis]|uniref:SCP domain-containing protein n=1 Tax=Nocardioides nanhaiensis TaxID=1476871 RepID=A0ABP8W191_9ACTN